MAIINFEQMKANEPNRNFDNAEVDENYNIGMQNGAGLYGAGKFFGLVQKAVNWLSSISGNKNFTGVVSMNDKKVATEEKAGELIATALTDYPTNSQTDTKISNALTNYEKISQTIPTNTNLDELINEGWYFVQSNSVASTITGKPDGVNYCFGLRVVKQKGANNYSQMLFPENSNQIFVRNFSTTWTSWEKLTTETDLETLDNPHVIWTNEGFDTEKFDNFGSRSFYKKDLNCVVIGLNLRTKEILEANTDYTIFTLPESYRKTNVPDLFQILAITDDKIIVNIFYHRASGEIRLNSTNQIAIGRLIKCELVL